MKKTYRYLMLALAGTAILSGCGKKDDDKHADEIHSHPCLLVFFCFD